MYLILLSYTLFCFVSSTYPSTHHQFSLFQLQSALQLVKQYASIALNTSLPTPQLKNNILLSASVQQSNIIAQIATNLFIQFNSTPSFQKQLLNNVKCFGFDAVQNIVSQLQSKLQRIIGYLQQGNQCNRHSQLKSTLLILQTLIQMINIKMIQCTLQSNKPQLKKETQEQQNNVINEQNNNEVLGNKSQIKKNESSNTSSNTSFNKSNEIQKEIIPSIINPIINQKQEYKDDTCKNQTSSIQSQEKYPTRLPQQQIICNSSQQVFNETTKQCIRMNSPQSEQMNSFTSKGGNSVGILPQWNSDLATCQQQTPFFDGQKCIKCNLPLYFDFEEKKCVECQNGTSFNSERRQCEYITASFYTNLERQNIYFDGDFSQETERRSQLKQDGRECSEENPYYDRSKDRCMKCEQETPLFSLREGRCTKCKEGSFFDEKTHVCLKRYEMDFSLQRAFMNSNAADWIF